MKKIIALVLAVLTLALVFASCGKEFKCDSCGETVKGKQYVEEIFGVEVEICKDCKKNLDEAKEDVNDLKDAIGGLFDDEK